MKSQEKRNDRLKKVLERLSRRKTVQNRQLKTLLGVEHYARYLDDYSEQEQLREMLGDKPKEIIEYEKRLKAPRSHTVKRITKVRKVDLIPPKKCLVRLIRFLNGWPNT